jgi:hypothetical protein
MRFAQRLRFFVEKRVVFLQKKICKYISTCNGRGSGERAEVAPVKCASHVIGMSQLNRKGRFNPSTIVNYLRGPDPGIYASLQQAG